MKNKHTFLTWFIFFAAGFLAGVGFSAWKLPTGLTQVRPGTSEAPQATAEQTVKKRVAALETMLKESPDNLAATIRLANDYFDLKRYEEAIRLYQKALAMDPRNPEVITDMGIAFRRLGKSKEAAEAFERALEVEPDHPMALFNIGIIYRDDLNEPEKAVKAWERFLEKHPNAPHAVMVKPWALQLKKKIVETDGNASREETAPSKETDQAAPAK